MTEPITTNVSTPVKAKGYVQAEGGIYRASDTNHNANIGVALGGRINKGSTFANAEVGYGTAFRAKAEVGHEFKLNKNGNMGLELAGNAEYLRNGQKSEYLSDVTTENNGKYTSKYSWQDGYKKAGVSGMLNFKGTKGNVKVGLEAGYRANNTPDINETYTINNNHIMHKTVKNHESGFYATPKVSAELNIGKKGAWSAIADADMHRGNVGIRYTF